MADDDVLHRSTHSHRPGTPQVPAVWSPTMPTRRYNGGRCHRPGWPGWDGRAERTRLRGRPVGRQGGGRGWGGTQMTWAAFVYFVPCDVVCQFRCRPLFEENVDVQTFPTSWRVPRPGSGHSNAQGTGFCFRTPGGGGPPAGRCASQ